MSAYCSVRTTSRTLDDFYCIKRMRTTRRRQVTEDASEPMCGRRKVDIWTTRWRRHKRGASSGCQPKEPMERPANFTKGTKYQTQKASGSTQTRPKRTCFCSVRRPKFAYLRVRRLTKTPPSEIPQTSKREQNPLCQWGTTATLDGAPLQSPRTLQRIVHRRAD